MKLALSNTERDKCSLNVTEVKVKVIEVIPAEPSNRANPERDAGDWPYRIFSNTSSVG